MKKGYMFISTFYVITVDPGGWAPTSLVQVLTAREIPKFLNKLASYTAQKTKDQTVMF